MWWWVIGAFAMEPPSLIEAPTLYRVDRPDWPGAVAFTGAASLLTEPPPPGTPYRVEPDLRVDGWPSYLTFDAVNAEAWHAQGFRGQGVKVAVFDVHWFSATADPSILGEVSTWDCFRHPSCELPMDTLRPRFAFEEGEHGFACAEIVHELAPEAELHLVRINGLASLENAVDWAIRHDIDLISMSMSFFNSSFYDGTGPFAAVVRRFSENGTLLVTSAGNSARQHWQGEYLDADADGRMDFDGANALLLDVGARATVYLNWDEYGRCGDSDLDAVLIDAGGYIVGRGSNTQRSDADTCSPVERLGGAPTEDGLMRFEVRAKRRVSAGLKVHVFSQSGSVVGAMPAGGIVDPGNHAAAFTVGAVRARGYRDNGPEGFSSQGPVGSGALKPDIAGPDGIDATPFGAEGFFGTSASTPAVAGTLAVLMSSDPSMTPRAAADKLSAWAWRDAATLDGHDDAIGAGRARLPELDRGVLGCGRGRLIALVPILPWGWRRRRGAPGGAALQREDSYVFGRVRGGGLADPGDVKQN